MNVFVKQVGECGAIRQCPSDLPAPFLADISRLVRGQVKRKNLRFRKLRFSLHRPEEVI